MGTKKQSIEGNNNVQVGVNNGDIKVIMTRKSITKVEDYNPILHISPKEQHSIKKIVEEIATIKALDNRYSLGSCMKGTWNKLYNKYKVPSYKLLPKEQYDDAIGWLKRFRAKERSISINKGLTPLSDLYGPIFLKAAEKGLDKEGVVNVANQLFRPRTPFTSIKDLSKTRLQKLYTYIFSK